MKTIISIFFLLFSYIGISAQTYTVPKYTIKTAEECTQYIPQINECINYLCNSTLNTDEQIRKNSYMFLMNFAQRSKDINIILDESILSMGTNQSENTHYTYMYIAGWVKNELLTGLNADLEGNIRSGIYTIINFYNNNQSYLSKNKQIEKLIKMKKKDTLQEFISQKAMQYRPQ